MPADRQALKEAICHICIYNFSLIYLIEPAISGEDVAWIAGAPPLCGSAGDQHETPDASRFIDDRALLRVRQIPQNESPTWPPATTPAPSNTIKFRKFARKMVISLPGNS